MLEPVSVKLKLKPRFGPNDQIRRTRLVPGVSRFLLGVASSAALVGCGGEAATGHAILLGPPLLDGAMSMASMVRTTIMVSILGAMTMVSVVRFMTVASLVSTVSVALVVQAVDGGERHDYRW